MGILILENFKDGFKGLVTEEGLVYTEDIQFLIPYQPSEPLSHLLTKDESLKLNISYFTALK